MSEDLIERLRNTSNMINMGEKISWGQDTAIMDEAAAEIERLRAKLADAEKVIAPFAAYASLSGFRQLPNDLAVTSGSFMAARQLTAGDLRAAAKFMEKGDE